MKETKEARSTLVFGNRGRGQYQDYNLMHISNIVKERAGNLERLIKKRASNESFISGLLTVLSVVSLLMVWYKLKKSMSGKLILGGLRGSSQTT